ncbi:serine protease [Lysinibacter sp. HNR]|uniref:S1 family peptidase n=1 Tax=Lysinibacter sp. HNR TaxID=3031408 RepID=UPI002434B82B|nr:serine protease [Lysinibacter sp. HNR]WGD37022.1 serine protease [Lysinibacter sp. HNR]
MENNPYRVIKNFTVAAVSLSIASTLFSAGVAYATPQSEPHDDTTTSYIVGGQDAPLGKYPFMVSVGAKYKSHFCGGTLISKNAVLTAAHCLVDQDTSNLRAYFTDGRTPMDDFYIGQLAKEKGNEEKFFESFPFIRGRDTNTKSFKISRVEYHPAYKTRSAKDPIISGPMREDHTDAAIMFLETPVTEIAPVTLSKTTGDARLWEGTDVTAIGWGQMRDAALSPDIDPKSIEWENPKTLQELHGPVLDHKICTANNRFFYDTQRHLCSGIGNTGVAKGDSGGPLLKASPESLTGWEQVGIVRSGSPFGPKAFTRVGSKEVWESWNTPGVLELRKELGLWAR